MENHEGPFQPILGNYHCLEDSLLKLKIDEVDQGKILLDYSKDKTYLKLVLSSEPNNLFFNVIECDNKDFVKFREKHGFILMYQEQYLSGEELKYIKHENSIKGYKFIENERIHFGWVDKGILYNYVVTEDYKVLYEYAPLSLEDVEKSQYDSEKLSEDVALKVCAFWIENHGDTDLIDKNKFLF